MKQVMPSGVLAASATTPARSPLVTHIFVPSRMYSSPSGVALHRMACVSLPASGSDSENAARTSPVAMRGSQLLALLVGAEPLDQVGRDGVGVEHAGERHPPVRQLFHQPGVGEHVELEAAVLLGDARPEDPERLHLLDHRLGVAVRVLVLGRVRDDVLAHPLANGGDELVGQRSVDRHGGDASQSLLSTTEPQRRRRSSR